MGANGNLQKGYTYDEFGSIEESGNVSFLNEVTFTGSVTDTSTGLQYMNSRYYDSSTGRFLTQDSYSGSPYDPWTQHLYSYCGNNPVNMVDPTGHFCISAIIIGAIVGAVIGAGIVGYQDYKDDGKIFNGSKTVGNYLMGAAVGGVVGAAAGTAVAAAAGGTAATAGLSALGKAAVSAGSAGAIGAGTNAAIQAASKGITNVDGKEAALAGDKSAAVSFVCSELGSLAKGSGAGQSLYNSKGSPSPGQVVKSEGTTNNASPELNPLKNVSYTNKVLSQMNVDKYHGFPSLIDSFGAIGKQTTITGGDGVNRMLVEIPGSLNGTQGVYQYILENGNICNHRLFVGR